MPSAAEKLADALRERRALIANQASRSDPSHHVRRLQEVSEKITELQASLPTPVDPQLAHFLARCSYDKALAFLEAL